MTITTKKWDRKKKTASVKTSKRRQSQKVVAAAADRAERKKIGKTLDLAAFMADFKRDTTSAAYWESKE